MKILIVRNEMDLEGNQKTVQALYDQGWVFLGHLGSNMNLFGSMKTLWSTADTAAVEVNWADALLEETA
jgi:hypothetical protein